MNVKPQREGFVEDDPVDESAPSTGNVKTIDAEPPEPALDLDLDVPEWPMTIKLNHKPIQKNRNEILNELTFREPSAMDIIRAGGNPCRIEITEISGGQVIYNPIIDDVKMMRLMANLTGLLEPQIQKMDPRDYASCAHRLRKYFLPEQGIW